MHDWFQQLVSLGLILSAMAAVVLVFRMLIRRPRGVSERDPSGIRSVAVFRGDAPEFFGDDRDDQPWIGIRLFTELCAGLAARGVVIDQRGPVESAQGARCIVEEVPFAVVLERFDDCWAASVEWSPRTAAEARHARLSRRMYAPGDSPSLRRLLTVLDAWLKSHPQLSDVRWHRKEEWIGGDTSDAAMGPIETNDIV